MEGLRGTNLHAAVMTQRRQLAGVLHRHVQPAAAKLFAALRAAPREEEDADGTGAGKTRARGWFGRGGERVAGGKVTIAGGVLRTSTRPTLKRRTKPVRLYELSR